LLNSSRKSLSFNLGYRGFIDKPGKSCHVLSFGPYAVWSTKFTILCHLLYTLSSLRGEEYISLGMSARPCNLVHKGIVLGGYHSRVLLVGEAYSVLVLTNVISGVSSPGFKPVFSTLCQHSAHTRDVADTQGRMEAQTKRHHHRPVKIWGNQVRTLQTRAPRMLIP
jgi:hypothetical protein